MDFDKATILDRLLLIGMQDKTFATPSRKRCNCFRYSLLGFIAGAVVAATATSVIFNI